MMKSVVYIVIAVKRYSDNTKISRIGIFEHIDATILR